MLSRVCFSIVLAGLLIANSAPGVARAADKIDSSNPFYSPSTLPFQAPPFDRIKDQDYQPAIEAGMAAQIVEIAAIANDRSAPTFVNTLLPLEKSGQLLTRASQAFNGVSKANTNPLLQKARADLAPEFAAHNDAIYLNEKLFGRVAAVYRARDTHHLDAESRRLIEFTYEQFVLAGANLSATDKLTLSQLNAEISTLSDTFSTKLLAATKEAAFHVDSATALDGFSDAKLAAAARDAHAQNQNGYLVTLQNTTQQPDFVALKDRATRQAIYEISWNRAERSDANDTRSTIARLAQLRAKRAKLLGYADHADWKLSDQMAKTPEAALKFMNDLVPAARSKATREGAEIQALMNAQHPGMTLSPWDWKFYGEQLRKAKYGLDDAQIKPYFELNNVLINGVFYAATRLYGITFTERKDIPIYQADVRVFEVHDEKGQPLALFYCDYFKRDNKSGGAWMSTFVDQSTLMGTRPVIYNVANLPKPVAGQPALIDFDDVITLFHEFGHSLHGLFANTRYASLSGAATPRDFVEFPSQFNEHWAIVPAVFNHYATHYKTGAVMPAELLQKLVDSQNFDTGYRLTELLSAAELDMKWHKLSADAPLQNPDEFEIRALQEAHLDLNTLPPRYRSSYFSHIWEGGYSAGYYAYSWTQMLAHDAYQGFEDNGGLTRANGERFRRMVLSRGNTADLNEVYRAWRGKNPTIGAMLKYRGLLPDVR